MLDLSSHAHHALRAALMTGVIVWCAPVVSRAQSLPEMPPQKKPAKVDALPAMPGATSLELDSSESSENLPVIQSPGPTMLDKSDLDDELIVVEVEIECASDDSYAQLLEELRLRLPEDIKVVTKPTPRAGRMLNWSWNADAGCRLVLHDAQGLIELPLAPEPEAEQLRQAVVRVAWFISMNRDTEGQLSIKPATVIGRPQPREVNGLPTIPVSNSEKKGLLSPPRPQPRETVVMNPSAGKTGSEQGTRFEALTGGWRTDSPNLFKKFRNFDEKPLTTSFLGEQAIVGATVSLSGDAMNIEQGAGGEPAWMGNVRAGMTIDDRVGLGFVYKRLSSSILHDPNWARLENPPPDAFSGLGSIRLNLVGMDTEAVILRRDAWTWRAKAGMHMGRVKSVSIEDRGSVGSFMMLGEVDTQLFLALLPWLEGGVGVGVRAPLLQANDWVVSPADLRGGFFVMNLRVKLF